MTPADFRQVVDSILQGIKSLEKEKGLEYSGTYRGKIDRLAQFKNVGDYRGMTPEDVLFGFVSKHWEALRTMIDKDEPIQHADLIKYSRDVIVYMMLLEGLVIDSATHCKKEG